MWPKVLIIHKKLQRLSEEKPFDEHDGCSCHLKNKCHHNRCLCVFLVSLPLLKTKYEYKINRIFSI